MELSLNTSQKP